MNIARGGGGGVLSLTMCIDCNFIKHRHCIRHLIVICHPIVRDSSYIYQTNQLYDQAVQAVGLAEEGGG